MPRKPLSFKEWSDNVFDGTKKENLKESEDEARRVAKMKRYQEMQENRLKKEKDDTINTIKDNDTDNANDIQLPLIIETGHIPIPMSSKLQNAIRWLDLFKKFLATERKVECDDAFSLQRSLHPQMPIIYINNTTEANSIKTDNKMIDKDKVVIKSLKKSEMKTVSMKQNDDQDIKVRVWMVSRVYYELRETFPDILEQIYNIFADERHAFQHQKKVGDNVFEGRLSAKSRFFSVSYSLIISLLLAFV